MANFKIISPVSVILLVAVATATQGTSSPATSEVTMETGNHQHQVLQRPGVAPPPELSDKNLQKRQSNFPDLLAPFRALFSGSRGARRPIGPEQGPGFKSIASETNPKHNTAASPYSTGSYGYRPSLTGHQGGFSGSSDDDEPSGFRNAYFNGMPQPDGANNIGQYHYQDDGGRQNYNQYYNPSSTSSSSNFLNQQFLKSQSTYHQNAPSQQYEQHNNYRHNNKY